MIVYSTDRETIPSLTTYHHDKLTHRLYNEVVGGVGIEDIDRKKTETSHVAYDQVVLFQ